MISKNTKTKNVTIVGCITTRVILGIHRTDITLLEQLFTLQSNLIYIYIYIFHVLFLFDY